MSMAGSTNRGTSIVLNDNGTLKVPENPVLVFVEGDGIGPDISKAAVRVFDAAVNKA
ncbi:MAG: NADP-dependent isocitrate dehydrogenase, partial [Phycisphaerae bacterium]|nr:NADP-dependent isocitrate dehydrogenase [Phycisphaerae bacterium]